MPSKYITQVHCSWSLDSCIVDQIQQPIIWFTVAGSRTLAELGVCEPQQESVYCSDLGLVQQGYSLSAGYDADSDPEGLMTPERAVQLWRGQGLKSHHSSGLSSPDQSALTLTDSENEHKTDDESGRTVERVKDSGERECVKRENTV